MIYAISEHNVLLNTIRNLNFETAFLNWYFITLAHLNRLETFYILAFVDGVWSCVIFINPFAKLPVSSSQLIVGMTRKRKACRNMSGAFFNSAYPIILEPGNFPVWTPKKQISSKGSGGGGVIHIDYFRIP